MLAIASWKILWKKSPINGGNTPKKVNKKYGNMYMLRSRRKKGRRRGPQYF